MPKIYLILSENYAIVEKACDEDHDIAMFVEDCARAGSELNASGPLGLGTHHHGGDGVRLHGARRNEFGDTLEAYLSSKELRANDEVERRA